MEIMKIIIIFGGIYDSTRLAEKAKKAEVDVTIKIWENMWHVFHAFAPIMPESKAAIEEIGIYINDKIGF